MFCSDANVCLDGVQGSAAPSTSRARANSYFSRRTSHFARKSDTHPISLQYFSFHNELRSVCSLNPTIGCHCLNRAEVSNVVDLPDQPESKGGTIQPKEHFQEVQVTGIEEMQFQLYLREIQRLNPCLKEGHLFVDGLYEMVCSRLPKDIESSSPVQSSPRDLITVHTSGSLLLQKYWHRPDDPSEYSSYLTVASSFVEYIHSTHGPRGVGRFLCQLDCSIEDPLEEEFSFLGKDILSLEFKWKKFVEAQISEKYRLSTFGMVRELLCRHLAKHWCLVALILAFVVVDVALHLAFALASGQLFSHGHRPEDHNISTIEQHGETTVHLLQWTGVLTAAILMRFVVVMISSFFQAYIAVKVSKKLRQKLSARLHQVTPKFLDDHSASSIISTFVQDIGSIELVIATGLRVVVWGALMLCTCIAFTLMNSWFLGLALTAVVFLGQLIVQSVSSALSDHSFAKSQALNKLGNLLKEQIDGFHINHLYGLSEFWMAQVDTILCRQYTKKALKSFVISKFVLLFQLLIPNVIGGFLTFTVIFLTQLDLLSFDRAIAVFVFFTTTVIALTAATSLFPQLQAAAISLGRINSLLKCEAHTSTRKCYQQELNQETKSSPFKTYPPRPGANAVSVEFKNVCFSYSSMASHWNLFDINLKVGAGERVVIVGGSGSGKSTLLHLLMKMYEPTHGTVMIGDDSSQDDDILRVAATFQFNHIFNMSIRENIRIGRLTATDLEVEEAAELADLHAWISSLPRGYDTAVSSGGSSLSGGQKQRIAIARMLLSGAPIFVLDEVTSALDPATEKRVFKKMMEVSVGWTVVAVTHRLDQADEFDRIIVLSHGRIKEEGTPAELMARKGAYWQMKTNKSMKTSPDRAVPILRRRGSLSSEIPLVPFNTPISSVCEAVLVPPGFIPLHTVAELGETHANSTVNSSATHVVPSIRIINASITKCSRGDTSAITIDSHPCPVGASTPDPLESGLHSTTRRIIVNLGNLSDCTSTHQGSIQHGSVSSTAGRSESQLGSIRQNVTVLCLDGKDDEEESDRDVSSHHV